MNILITGATGFIGRNLINHLILSNDFQIHALIRKPVKNPIPTIIYSKIDNLTSTSQLQYFLTGVDIVIHAAARAHVLNETETNPLKLFREINVNTTLNIANQAACLGVKRFIYISSIGVNGLSTTIHQPFTERDIPKPHNPYAISKWEAEQGLVQLANESKMEIVIIRPPLVYGPNAPGNFGSLMKAIQRGLLLPLGAIQNQRSLVGIDNLVDFISVCIKHPNAANQTFLVSDGEDLSTPGLIQGIADAAGVKARLIPVPVWALTFAGKLTGKSAAIARLSGNLQLDISKAQQLLGWTPPVSVTEGLRRAVQPVD